MAVQPRLDPGGGGTIQPTQPTAQPDIQADVALAGQEAKNATETGAMAGQVQQFAVSVMRDETLKQAQHDAAQVQTPGDLESKRGWGGIFYNQTFEDAAVAQYKGIALQEAQAKANDLVSRNPTNPGAVDAQLTEYLDAKTKAMRDVAPYMADVMAPHFAAVRSGAINSATAGATRMDLAGIEKSSNDQLNGLILNYSKTVASKEFEAAPQDVKDATIKRFADQRADIEAQLKTYMTPDQIARTMAQADNLVQANRYGIELQERANGMGRDPVGIQRLANEADAWAKAPERAQYYTQTQAVLNNYIQRGSQMASAVQQADALDAADKQGVIAMKFDSLKREQQTTGMPAPEYARRHGEIIHDAITMGLGKRPAQQAQILAAAGDAAPVLQQIYGSAMISASNAALNGTTPVVRAQGYADVEALGKDPKVTALAGSNVVMAGLVQQASKITSMRVANGQVAQVAVAQADLESDTTTEATLGEKISKYNEQNLIGPQGMSHEQALNSARIGIAKNKVKVEKEGQATAQVGNWQNGGGPVATESQPVIQDQAKTLFTTQNANGTPGPTGFVWNNAGHVDKAVAFAVNTSVMPEGVQKWAAGVTATSPPEQQQALVRMEERIRSGLINRSNKINVSPELQKIDVETNLDKILGDDTRNKVSAFVDGKFDPAQVRAAMEKQVTNQGRNAPKEELDSYQAKLTSMFADSRMHPPDMVQQGAMAALSFPASFFSGGPGWLNKQFTMFGNSDIRAIMGTLKNYEDTEKFSYTESDNYRISPAAAARLEDRVSSPGGIMSVKGDSFRKAGIADIAKAATVQAMKDDPSDFSVRMSIDPNTGKTVSSLEYKDFFAEFNKANTLNGVPLDWKVDKVKAFVGAQMKIMRPYQYDQINPDTIDFVTQIGKGGVPYHYMVAQSKDGQTSMAFPVRPDDPAYGVQRAAMGEAVAYDMSMPSWSRFISTMPGTSLFREWIKNNKEEAWADMASGRNVPPERAAQFLSSIRDAVHAMNTKRIAAGQETIPFVSDADIGKMSTKEAQNTIGRFGTLYYMMFGAQPSFPRPPQPDERQTGFEDPNVTPQTRSLTDPIRDVVIPPTDTRTDRELTYSGQQTKGVDPSRARGGR